MARWLWPRRLQPQDARQRPRWSVRSLITMKISEVSTPVVVLRGVESASHGALGLLRSLGRLGVPVYAVACHRRTAAFSSRYCKGKYVWNVTNGHAESSVNFLLDVGRKIGGRAILIPTDDKALLFCASCAETLREQEGLVVCGDQDRPPPDF